MMNTTQPSSRIVPLNHSVTYRTRKRFTKDISLDTETKSGYKLKLCGLHRYVESPEFKIIWVAYKWRGEKTRRIDLTKNEIPEWFKKMLVDPTIRKRSHNAAFEREAFQRELGIYLPPDQWCCSMVQAARAGYPLGLEAAAKATDSPIHKDKEGKRLIKKFTEPQKPTKKNQGKRWIEPDEDPEDWNAFGDYCVTDVDTEVAILNKTAYFPVSDFEHELWALDQKINETGIKIDRKLVTNALAIYNDYVANLKAEAIQITSLGNPNSPKQLMAWLIDNGIEVMDLKKATVAELLEDLKKGNVSRVLEIRQEMSKTSVKKYSAMLHSQCRDGRVRGLLQFYGAMRTGRWAGRLIQVQNLPQNKLKVDLKNGIDDLSLARSIVRMGDGELLAKLYGNVPDILSQLIRTALVAEKGHELLICDYAAIEARVIAWLFGEKWRLDVFATHGKIYEASASNMFGVSLESIGTSESPGPNWHLRAKGKVAELALGYQGSVGALINMGALKMGLTEEELLPLVKAWRKANRKIVQGWYRLQDQVIEAIENPGMVITSFQGIRIFVDKGNLFIQLPSGRYLTYVGVQVRLKKNPNKKFGPEFVKCIKYKGVDKTWTTLETYGGKITENIVQAIARDCMAVGLMRLDYKGYKICLHVHDEVVAEAKKGEKDIKEMERIMALPMKWAPTLPLRAEGFKLHYYKK